MKKSELKTGMIVIVHDQEKMVFKDINTKSYKGDVLVDPRPGIFWWAKLCNYKENLDHTELPENNIQAVYQTNHPYSLCYKYGEKTLLWERNNQSKIAKLKESLGDYREFRIEDLRNGMVLHTFNDKYIYFNNRLINEDTDFHVHILNSSNNKLYLVYDSIFTNDKKLIWRRELEKDDIIKQIIELGGEI